MRIPFWRRHGWWLTVAVSFVIALLPALAFTFPSAAAFACPRCFGFQDIGNAIFVERSMAADARTNAVGVVERARERVAKFYGSRLSDASVLICATDDCYRRLNGGESYGMAIYDFALVLSPRGVDETIAAHELSHIEFHTRIGAWNVFRDSVPVWFDEGLAVVVSDDRRYLDPPEMADSCRGRIYKPLPDTLREWLRVAEKDRLYYAAACQVNGWIAAKGGPAAVLRLAQRIAGGESFADAYR
jgi:hypothetical protein